MPFVNIDVEVAGWNLVQRDATRIRHAVFVREQGVPVTMELDGRDGDARHGLARIEGAPVGTGRLLPDGHLGRLAVLAAWRGHGVGTALLQALVDEARGRGLRRVCLHAQVHAEAFYARRGFVPRGDVFLEAGLRHRAMELSL